MAADLFKLDGWICLKTEELFSLSHRMGEGRGESNSKQNYFT